MKTLHERHRERLENTYTTSNRPDWMQPRKVKPPETRHPCKRCGKLVDNGRRSTAIDLTDPHHYFCTLRCAAEFGVAFVNYLERK